MKDTPLQRFSESELMAIIQCELLEIQAKAISAMPPKAEDFVYAQQPSPQPLEQAIAMGAY